MKIFNKKLKDSIARQIPELVDTISNWVFIILAMIVFALISFSLEQLIGEKVWIIFLLDIIFCGFFFIAITKTPKCISSKFYRGRFPAVYFVLIFLIIIIVAATFGCFNNLYARFNILVFPFMVFSTIFFSIYYKTYRRN